MHLSIQDKIKKRIFSHGRGWCFTLLDFSDLGSDASIRKALSDLQKQKIIRRLAQGIYDYPQMHKLLGIIAPDLNAVANAIARKNRVRIQPSGAHAANLVGLSTQVPGQIIFLTEGLSKKVKIGNQTIIFKSATKKTMSSAGTQGGLLIQALKNLGKDHINPIICARVAKYLKNSNEKEIRKSMETAPAWIREIVIKILENKQ